MTDTTREAFEAHAKTKYVDITRGLNAWDCDIYKHSHVDAMWFGWQAATLAAQDKRQPLTDSEIISMAYECNALPEVVTDETLKVFAREIEAAHGIKA